MIRSLLSRLGSAGRSVWHFLLEMQVARLAIIARRLWPELKLPAALVVLLLCCCIALAVSAARSVHLTLSPASPTGFGAALAALITFVLILELAAFAVTAAFGTTLQLARELGRHRMAVLLVMTTILAIATTAARLHDGDALSWDAVATFGVAAALLALTTWFQRHYRNPAWRRFRDFHVDVIEAQRFLLRDAHGV